MVFQKTLSGSNKTPNMKNKKSLGMNGGGGDGKSGNKSMNKTPKGKQFSGDNRVNFQVSNQRTPQSYLLKQNQATPRTPKGQTATKEFQRMKGKPGKQNKNSKLFDDEDDDDDDDMDDDLDMELGAEEDADDSEDDDEDDDDDVNENRSVSKASFKETAKLGGRESNKKSPNTKKEMSDDDDDMDDDFDMDLGEEDDDDSEDDDKDDDDDEGEEDDDENENISKASIKKTEKQVSKESSQNSNAKSVKQGNELNKKNLKVTNQKKKAEEDSVLEEKNNEETKIIVKDAPSSINKNKQSEETTASGANEGTPVNCKLFIGNLSADVQAEEIKSLSADIISVSFPAEKKSKKWCGSKFAFLTFASEALAEKNFSVLNQQTLRGQPIRVDFEGDKRTPVNCKLFIGNLPADVQAEEIKSLSSDITSVFFPAEKKSKRGCGYKYAFLTFSSEAVAEKNFAVLNQQTVRGLPIKVEFARDKSKKQTDKSKKQPAEKMNTSNVKDLIVLGIPLEVTVHKIASFFPKACGVEFRGREPRKAYINFQNAIDAANALDNNKIIKLSDREMKVDFAWERKNGDKRKHFGREKFPFAKKMRREQ